MLLSNIPIIGFPFLLFFSEPFEKFFVSLFLYAFFANILCCYAEEYYENRNACQNKVEFHIAFIFGKDTENSAKQQVF